MVKKENIFQKFENSWIFWVAFILIAMAIFTIAVAGPGYVLQGYIFIPLGILILFKVLPESNIAIWITIITWYSVMIVLIRFIVKDKRFNTKLIVIMITLLLLTLKGCTDAGGF
jgi:hypothetical protein